MYIKTRKSRKFEIAQPATPYDSIASDLFYYCGLDYVLHYQGHILNSQSTVPQIVTLYGNRLTAYVVKTRSHWRRVGLVPHNWCPFKESKIWTETHIQGEHCAKTSCAAIAK